MLLVKTPTMAENACGYFMRTLKIIFILSLINLGIYAQSNWIEKKLTRQIFSPDSLTITISDHKERFKKEVNIIYYQNKKLKIHSIYYSDSLTNLQIDATFFLSKKQLDKIDKFGRNLQNHDLNPTEVVNNGSKTFYTVTLNNNPITTDDRIYYSLILDLLKN